MNRANWMWMRASVALVAAAAAAMRHTPVPPQPIARLAAVAPGRLLHAWIVVWMLAALGACAVASAQDKGAGFNDERITQRVSSAFAGDPVLKHMHIAVQTHDRVVHLTGFVDSMVQMDRAAALAQRVEGVSAVRNAIRVTNRPSRA